ncbi:hypothetical protein CEP54_000992, partial [Fusarium duplospermum]
MRFLLMLSAIGAAAVRLPANKDNMHRRAVQPEASSSVVVNDAQSSGTTPDNTGYEGGYEYAPVYDTVKVPTTTQVPTSIPDEDNEPSSTPNDYDTVEVPPSSQVQTTASVEKPEELSTTTSVAEEPEELSTTTSVAEEPEEPSSTSPVEKQPSYKVYDKHCGCTKTYTGYPPPGPSTTS